MESLIYTATPNDDGFAPLTVSVVRAESAEERKSSKIMVNGALLPGGIERAYLSHVRSSGDQGKAHPTLALTKKAAKTIYGLDVEQTIHVPLDREWAGEVEALAAKQKKARQAAALLRIEEGEEIQVEVSRSFGTGTYYHVWGAGEEKLDEDVREYLNQSVSEVKGDGAGRLLSYEYREPDDRGGTAYTTATAILEAHSTLQKRRAEKGAKKSAAFEEAKRTGEPVELSSYGCVSDELPRHFSREDREEGDWCEVVRYALPDGSTTDRVFHSY